MAERKITEFFGEKTAGSYDERNRKIRAVNDNLHLLIRLVLEGLPEDASILCVGVGTGADILGLADAFPGWKFTGVEPSEHMLAVCRERLRERSLLSRCELVHGYLGDMSGEQRFDAVLCLLVTQFVKASAARREMFGNMSARLKPGGFLVNSEICGDTASEEFQDMMRAWKAMHRLTGAADKQLEGMVQALREHVAVEPPSVIEGYLREAGLALPVQFFQSLFIRAWYSCNSIGTAKPEGK